MSRMLYSNQGFGRPQWVMCGVDNPDPEYPCRLIASDKLTMAELEYRANYADIFDGGLIGVPFMTSRQLTLTTYMTDLVLIDGKTWQHCFDALFRDRRWTPNAPAIEARHEPAGTVSRTDVQE